MEVTLTFVIDDETQAEEFDARPIARVPPIYPEKCMRAAKNTETVVVQFDVNGKGETENIEIAESTNSCLGKAAVRSVAQWKYRPKIVNGAPVMRRGVETVVTFNLGNRPQKEYRMRGALQSKLQRARRYVRGQDKLEEASAILQDVYQEYGETFSDVELSAYHQVRAIVKYKQKEYAAALDSLRLVYELKVVADDAGLKAIEGMIYQLEQALGAGPTASAPGQGDDEAPASEND